MEIFNGSLNKEIDKYHHLPFAMELISEALKCLFQMTGTTVLLNDCFLLITSTMFNV